MKEINITFIADDNYALCTGVAISSLRMNRSIQHQYNIYIISNGISDKNQNALRSMQDDHFVIYIIDGREIVRYEYIDRVKGAKHASPTALYKFDLPEVFPKIDKMLYVDGDVIIRDNLVELFSIDISNCYAAVCKDIGAETSPHPYNSRLQIKHDDYFNSGVLLLNLKLLREDGISGKLIEYRKNGINDYMDQDAFNVVFNENVVYFSILYNMQTSSWYSYPVGALNAYFNEKFASKEEMYSSAKILHFTSPQKPWIYSDVIGSVDWFMAYAQSPFSSICSIERKNFVGKNYVNELKGEIDVLKLPSKTCNEYLFNKKPLVSVIIPVYNAERYLGECVESLILQTLKNVEFIFVDDGSTDRSLDMLRMYERLDSRIHVYTQKNAYAGIARNNGISHAKGEYITFLDSDDRMVAEALEMMYRTAKRLCVDVVICSAYSFSDDSEKRRRITSCLNNGYLPMQKVFSIRNHSKYLMQVTAGAPWGKMFRKELIEKNGLTFPSLPRSEDIAFVFSALACAESISTLDMPLFLHRENFLSGSLEDSKDRYPLTNVQAYSILASFLKERGLWETLKQSFVNYTMQSIAYNLNTFKSGEGFGMLADYVRNQYISEYQVDLEEAEFFYNRTDLSFIKTLYEYSAVDYLFNQYKTYRLQATKHWQDLKEARNIINKSSAAKLRELQNENEQLKKEKCERWQELQSLRKEKGERWQELQTLRKEKAERWQELQQLRKERVESDKKIAALTKEVSALQDRLNARPITMRERVSKTIFGKAVRKIKG